MALAGMAGPGLLGIGFFVMSQRSRKSSRPAPDPDADYREDAEYELPEDDSFTENE